MKRKYVLACSSALLLCSILLTACGGASVSSTAKSASQNATAPSSETDAAFSEDNTSSSTKQETTVVPAETDKTANSNSVPAMLHTDDKLILRAELTLEAKDFDTASRQLQAMATTYGGYIENMDISGTEGYRTASYTVRVPQEKYEICLSAIGNAATIVEQTRSAEDVADQYYDTETRLKTQQAKHERLLALLKQSADMEQILQLENALSDTEYEIDTLSGTLKEYDNLIGYATIQATLQETAVPAASAKASFSGRFGNALLSGGKIFLSAVQGVLLVAAYLWPLFLLCVIGLIAFFAIRRQRKLAAAAQQEKVKLPPVEKQAQDSGSKRP